MHPILFRIGDFPIHTYGFLGAVGFLVVVALSVWRGRKAGLAADHIVDVIFWAAVGGVFGARLIWVLQNPEFAPTWREWVNLRMGGLVFYGAVIFGIPAAIATMRYRKVPVFVLSDVFAAALPIGHGISRIGCFFAGCCYGTQSDLPWAVVFSHSLADAPTDVALHPTQLYEAMLLFGISGFLAFLYRRKRFDGQVLLTYLGLYAILRFFVELVRGDLTRGFFLEGVLGQTLSLSQGLALLFLLGVGAAWYALSRRASVAEESP